IDVGDNLVAIEEPVRVVADVLETGQAEHPVGRRQRKGVPALAAPGFADGALLQKQVVAAALVQVITGSQPSLAGANHRRFKVLDAGARGRHARSSAYTG